MTDQSENNTANVSRRHFVAGATAIAATAALTNRHEAHAMARMPDVDKARDNFSPRAPFDSIRDWLAALEQVGQVLRFHTVDQDAWEATAIMYKLSDTYGLYDVPTVIFENIKIDGEWFPGPLVGNFQSHYHDEALIWGLEPDWNFPKNSYRKGLAYMRKMLRDNNGAYPEIEPNEVSRDQAPCKEITIEGDTIDITRYAFIQGNPGDAGRYINTASTFSYDPEWEQNFGTYRCQITGPRDIMLNSEPNQTANRMFERAMERGEKAMKIALVLGQDPVTWMVSGSRVPLSFTKPVDEIAVVGGMRGKALDVVRADLNDKLLLPAHSELVLEGTVDLTRLGPEGPYHETYGYLGEANAERFFFRVERITQRKNPVVMNSFTSIGGGFVKAPMDAYQYSYWGKKYPQITGFYYRDDTKGITYISIKKDRPGLGLEIAEAYVKFSVIAKVVIVVDDDMDVLNRDEMLLALGSRWQPAGNTTIFEKRKASFFEPSSPDGKTTSKIAIDATMQWPEEGGPKEFPKLNRNLFEAAAPDAMASVSDKWPQYLRPKI